MTRAATIHRAGHACRSPYAWPAIAWLALVATAGCSRAPPIQLEPTWTATGLLDPESIALGEDGSFLYVSNVDGDAAVKDGKGSISRLGRDGKMLEAAWVEGLHAPKGIALHDGHLYVSDIDALVEIDIASAAIVNRHAVADAQFLNDVAITRDGEVLVSDSSAGRIHVLRDGQITPWLDDPLLARVNGLLPQADRLIAATMEGRLLAIDWTSKAITPLAKGLGKADGIGALAEGGFVVSDWPGRLFHVDTNGRKSILLDVRKQSHTINDLLLDGDALYLPNWEPGTISAYRIKR